MSFKIVCDGCNKEVLLGHDHGESVIPRGWAHSPSHGPNDQPMDACSVECANKISDAEGTDAIMVDASAVEGFVGEGGEDSSLTPGKKKLLN